MDKKVEKILKDAAPVFGVCPFSAVKDRLISCRASARLPQNAVSIIVAAFPYYLGEDGYDGLNISRYAAVTDYHALVGERLNEAAKQLNELFPSEHFAAFADNSPIPEVEAAVRACIGVIGKNGLLINRDYGSWVFIGEIVTTLDLTDNAASSPALCVGCDRCVEACPTGALSGGSVDREKCLSDITQRKGELTDEQKLLMQKHKCAWGCDICQSVCPMNKSAKTTPIKEFICSAKPNAVSGMEIDDRAFAWRGRTVIERNLGIIEQKP